MNGNNENIRHSRPAASLDAFNLPIKLFMFFDQMLPGLPSSSLLNIDWENI